MGMLVVLRIKCPNACSYIAFNKTEKSTISYVKMILAITSVKRSLSLIFFLSFFFFFFFFCFFVLKKFGLVET